MFLRNKKSDERRKAMFSGFIFGMSSQADPIPGLSSSREASSLNDMERFIGREGKMPNR
jgi:hypothetical protein